MQESSTTSFSGEQNKREVKEVSPSKIETTALQSKDLDAVLSELPTLSEGWVRLTHFTNDQTAQAINNGAPFNYDKQGQLSTTTDAFSAESMDQMRSLLSTGMIGAQERFSFGSNVLLMDLDAAEHKKRLNFLTQSNEIPNHNVVGYVQILRQNGEAEKKFRFFPNAAYSPQVNEVTIAAPLALSKPSPAGEAGQKIPHKSLCYDDG